MGLLDKIKKPTDDYIAVSHFIKKLSEKNNFPVSDVITYLNHHDFVEKIHAFYINTDLKIIGFNSFDYENLQTRLDNLKSACMFTDFVWTDGNFDKLKQSTPPSINLEPFYALANPYDSMHWHFKKQDLADFEPLQDYVNFLGIIPTPKEYPLFYKNDFFDLTECESMITGFDPYDGWRCSEREQAYNLVLASVHNGKFKPHPHRENDYLISADDFREWLLAKDIFIDGFTNTLNKKTQDGNQNQTADLQQIADLQADNVRLQARITQLESQLNQAKDSGAPAFDTLLDTGHEYHAPDLAHAVRLWLDIYANGKPKDDSHTNLANVWIGKYTNYNAHDDGYQMMQNRIREIATPLKDFGKKRIKESKK